ncbi:MAG: GIY-YIG nuclease family protein [Thermoguttaceae bacterium]|nr:GIY-YIG nuclease family protein [Thermoguttaceae bacterium]
MNQDISKILAELENDPLFDPPTRAARPTRDERENEGVRELGEFLSQTGRLPSEDGDGREYQLFTRWQKILKVPEKFRALREFDVHGVLADIPELELEPESKEFRETETLEELLAGSAGLFQDSNDIFTLRHVKAPTVPDYIAQAKPCRDFEPFRQRFLDCRRDLEKGERTSSPFVGAKSIKEGAFFVIRGMLALIAEVGKEIRGKERPQHRVRCVYENGTEIDILDHSLAKAMYGKGGGKIISPNNSEILSEMFGPREGDLLTGFVYVLKSLSKDPAVRAIPNLHKIGFSRGKVKERIKNAEQELTYLMAKVKPVAEFEIFNVDPQIYEKTLHDFFAPARFSIDIWGQDGSRHTVREWFDLPLSVIGEAVRRIEDGSLEEFEYDPKHKALVPVHR